jgi:hypothetical protein
MVPCTSGETHLKLLVADKKHATQRIRLWNNRASIVTTPPNHWPQPVGQPFLHNLFGMALLDGPVGRAGR